MIQGRAPGLPLFHVAEPTVTQQRLKRIARTLMNDRQPSIGNSDPDSCAEVGGAPLVRAGSLVDLRQHTSANREPFIRWYADREIAAMLRHDLEPLNRREATAYFSNIIMPLSERGQCWAIHRHDTGQLIGTAAVTDVSTVRHTCLYRLVIGEKDAWGQGFGTEATRLVAQEVFATLPVTRFRLEVFAHNERARRAYERVGFRAYDRYEERVPAKQTVLDIIAMELTPESLASNMPLKPDRKVSDSETADAPARQ
jgi:RimJ/RimL family protein N-acetyltransferase